MYAYHSDPVASPFHFFCPDLHPTPTYFCAPIQAMNHNKKQRQKNRRDKLLNAYLFIYLFW